MSNFPPPEPPDLGRGRGQGQQSDDQERSSQSGKPPRGGRNYPSQQQYPPSEAEQERRRGTGPLPPRQPGPLGGRQQRPPKRQTGRQDNPFVSDFQGPSRLGGRGGGGGSDMGFFHERRIEYLAWGTVVLVVGVSIILLALDTSAAKNILLIVSPTLAGFILLASGFIQQIFFNYPVSLVTWGTAIFATSFGLTQFIALITDRRGMEYFTTQTIFFVGLLVIITGMVIILQVFRQPDY